MCRMRELELEDRQYEIEKELNELQISCNYMFSNYSCMYIVMCICMCVPIISFILINFFVLFNPK